MSHRPRTCLTVTACLALAATLAGCGHSGTTTGTPTRQVPPAATAGSVSPVASGAIATAAATRTPALTDTGYTAPDGSPLYKECVAAGLALPAVYPTPAATEPVPSPISPSVHGDTAPPPSAVPAFDPMRVAPAATTAWHRVFSPCMRLTFRYPPSFGVITPLSVHGYQQRAAGSYGTADRHVIVELLMSYTTEDAIGLVRASPLAPGEYRFVNDEPATVGGAPGYVTYMTEPHAQFAQEVAISYIVSPRPHWYLQVIGVFAAPYSKPSFADFNAVVSSIAFTH